MALRGELFIRWPEWELGEDRRASAALRLELYHGAYKERVQKLIKQRIRDKATAAEIARCVQVAHGLAGTVTDVVAVAYQRGCQRELRGVAEPVAKAFADLVDESGIAERAQSLNALSWLAGPIIVAPYVADVRGVPRLGFHVCTPDRTEVRRSETAPDVLDAVLWQRDDGSFVELDAEGWHYWTAKGERIEDGVYDRPHGLDYCPAVPIRSRPWMTYDWWNAIDHRGLVDATLEVSLRHAIGMWVRSQNLADLVVISGPDESIPKLQSVGHPSRPLYFDAPPGQIEVKVEKRSSNPAEYLMEIAALVNAAVSRYGIPPSEVTFENSNANWGALSVNVRGERLAAQRDAQAPWLRRSERALWQVVCAVVAVSAHRHASLMPSPVEVETSLRVMFPDLSSPDDQIKRAQALKERLPLGLANHVDDLMASRPELTRAEAEELAQANIQTYIDTIVPLVERNVSADPARGVQTIAQVQGREGGVASGESRRADAQQ